MKLFCRQRFEAFEQWLPSLSRLPDDSRKNVAGQSRVHHVARRRTTDTPNDRHSYTRSRKSCRERWLWFANQAEKFGGGVGPWVLQRFWSFATRAAAIETAEEERHDRLMMHFRVMKLNRLCTRYIFIKESSIINFKAGVKIMHRWKINARRIFFNLYLGTLLESAVKDCDYYNIESYCDWKWRMYKELNWLGQNGIGQFVAKSGGKFVLTCHSVGMACT